MPIRREDVPDTNHRNPLRQEVDVTIKKIINTSGLALEETLQLILAAFAAGSGGITADVNVLTSVLPTGAATQATLALIKDTDGIKKITDAVAVTGTFWQATQPVSGTFWQATQPVSGTVAVTTLKPDGTNTAPSMDDAARAGWIQEKENVPTAASKNNPSTALTYDVDDQLTQIDMTIGAVVYRKTLTWTTGNLTAVSAWSVV